MMQDIFSRYTPRGERFIALFILIALLSVVAAIGMAVYTAVDSAGVKPVQKETTVVTGKYVMPPTTTTTFIQVGDIMIPQEYTSPETYHLIFYLNDNIVETGVDRDFFVAVKEGDTVEVGYGKGRLSGSDIPVSVRIVADR